MSERFLGWRVVFALALTQACGVGLLQGYGPLVNPLAVEFGVDPGTIGSGMAVFIVALAVTGAILGGIVDRGDVRRIMTIGIAVMAGGFAALSFATEPWHLVAGVAIASVGIATYGPLPANATIVRWFAAKRGTALAISAAGPALAGFGIPLATAAIVAAAGWRVALQVLGGTAAVLALLAVVLGVIGRPGDVGQTIDGTGSLDPAGAPDEAPDGVREWLVDRDFWLLSIGIGLVMAVPVGMGLYMVPFLEDIGIAPQRAALGAVVAAVFGFIGTLSSGVLADRFPPKVVLFTWVGLFAVSFAALSQLPGFGMGLVAAAGMGLGTGGVAPIHPLFIGSRFGPDVMAGVMGIQGLIGLPLIAAAPILAGAVRDATGRYEPAFLGAAGVLVVAALFLAAFRPKPPAGLRR